MSVRKDKVQLSVEINGKKAGGSLKELQATAKGLKRQLLNTTDPKKAAEYAASLRKVNGRMKDIWAQTRDVKKETSLWKRTLATLSVAGLVAGAVQGIRSVISLGKESLKLFDIQAKADAQLKAVIASTNGAAKKSYQELKDEAAAFQQQSLYGDEVIQKAQATLLTFTKIQGETFTQGTQVVLDYSTALGTDLQSASIQVGKALNDPIKGVSALGEAGVQFSEDQKLMIKALQESGDIAGAQAIVLKELETQFAGSAKAAAEAGLGPYTQLSNRLDDVKESVGLLIEKGLKVLAPFLNHVVIFIENFVNSIVSGEKATGQFSGAINFLIGTLKMAVKWYGFLYDASVFVISSFTRLIAAARELPIIGRLISGIVKTFGFLYDAVANTSAVWAGMQAAAKTAIDNVKRYIDQAVLKFKIFAKNAELALTIRPSTREKLKAEIKNLENLKEDAAKSGKTVGEAYDEAYRKALSSKPSTPAIRNDRVPTQTILATDNPSIAATAATPTTPTTAPTSIAKEKKEKTNAYTSMYEHLAAIAQKYAKKRLADAERTASMELDQLEKNFLLGLYTEEEYARLSREQKLKNKETELAVLAELGLSETDIFRNTELEKLRVQKEIDDESIAQAQRTAEIKKMLQEDSLNTFREVVDSSIGLLAKDEAARKKNAGIIKAFETSKIAVNSAVEISEIFKGFAALGPFGQLLAVGKAFAAALRARTAIAQVQAQSFYTGGRVLPSFSGQLINATSNIPTQRGGDSVLATLKPGEVVLNDEQQARAGGPSFFRSIGVPGFDTGGMVFTSASTVPKSISRIPSASASAEDTRIMGDLSQAVSMLTSVLSNGINANVGYGNIEAVATDVARVRRLSSL